MCQLDLRRKAKPGTSMATDQVIWSVAAGRRIFEDVYFSTFELAQSLPLFLTLVSPAIDGAGVQTLVRSQPGLLPVSGISMLFRCFTAADLAAVGNNRRSVLAHEIKSGSR